MYILLLFTTYPAVSSVCCMYIIYIYTFIIYIYIIFYINIRYIKSRNAVHRKHRKHNSMTKVVPSTAGTLSLGTLLIMLTHSVTHFTKYSFYLDILQYTNLFIAAYVDLYILE